MKRTLIASIVAMVAASTLIAFAAATAFSAAAAQTGTADSKAGEATPPGPAPRMADGRPVLSGVWGPGRDLQVRPLGSPAPTPPPAAAPPRDRPPSFTSLYQPWALEKRKTLSDKDDPSLRCVPVAFGTVNVSLYGLGFVGQIVQTPKFVIMLTETYHGFRIIQIGRASCRERV